MLRDVRRSAGCATFTLASRLARDDGRLIVIGFADASGLAVLTTSPGGADGIA